MVLRYHSGVDDQILRGVVVGGELLLTVSILGVLELPKIKLICFYLLEAEKVLAGFIDLVRKRVLCEFFSGCGKLYNIF